LRGFSDEHCLPAWVSLRWLSLTIFMPGPPDRSSTAYAAATFARLRKAKQARSTLASDDDVKAAADFDRYRLRLKAFDRGRFLWAPNASCPQTLTRTWPRHAI